MNICAIPLERTPHAPIFAPNNEHNEHNDTNHGDHTAGDHHARRDHTAGERGDSAGTQPTANHPIHRDHAANPYATDSTEVGLPQRRQATRAQATARRVNSRSHRRPQGSAHGTAGTARRYRESAHHRDTHRRGRAHHSSPQRHPQGGLQTHPLCDAHR